MILSETKHQRGADYVKRSILAILLGACLVVLTTSTAHAQGDCRFVLGFKTLRDLIGHEIVGQCLENEHYNEIGDSLQQTTGGLLVWRKADNWTAFTDGYRTWINGPNGIQQRLNTARFEWEADYAPGGGVATPTPPPIPTPPPPPPQIDPALGYALQVMRTTPSGEEAYQWFANSGIGASLGGTEGGEGQVYSVTFNFDPNTIVVGGGYRDESPDVLAVLLLGSIAFMRTYVEPQSVEDCFSMLENMYAARGSWWHEKFGDAGKHEPSSYWELRENLRMAQQRTGILGNRILRNDSSRTYCANFGEVPPKPRASLGSFLGHAFQVMRTTPIGERIYQQYLAADAGATLATVKDAYALYFASDNEIVVSYTLRNESYDMIALRLLHETVHAAGQSERGGRFTSAEECYQEEITAHSSVAIWWQEKYGRNGKQNPVSRGEQGENNRLAHFLAGSLDDWVRSHPSHQRVCEHYRAS